MRSQTTYAENDLCLATGLYVGMHASDPKKRVGEPRRFNDGKVFPAPPHGAKGWVLWKRGARWDWRHWFLLFGSLLLGFGSFSVFFVPHWVPQCDLCQSQWLIGIVWLLGAVSVALLLATLAHAINGRIVGWLINEQNHMSLSRFQIFLWMVLVLSAYMTAVLANLYTGKRGADALDIAIPELLWLAMGISTVSLVGSGLILTPKKKKEPTNDAVENLALSLGKITPDEFATAKKTNQQLDQDLPAAQAAATAKGVSPPDLQTLKQERDNAKTKVETAVQAVKDNELNGVLHRNMWASDASPTDLVSGEEAGNAGVLVPTRFFNLIVTLILVGVYAMNLANTLATEWMTGITSFPELGAASATLLALTHAAYLADKVPDKEDVNP